MVEFYSRILHLFSLSIILKMMVQRVFALILSSVLISYGSSQKEKIVGGKDASISNFPYQVTLKVNGNHICGGSIISNRHILTAAHCIVGMVRAPYTNFKVVTGTSNSVYGGQSHNVLRVTTHPQYTGDGSNSYKNDIAVITLSAPIVFNSVQQVINLPSTDIRGGESAVMTGWGLKAYPNVIQSTTLQQISMKIIASAQCQQYHHNIIHKEHVCAFNSYGKGICMGDSGGPLVVNGAIVGIASWVIPCAVGTPDVYTKVFAYKAFIEQIMQA